MRDLLPDEMYQPVRIRLYPTQSQMALIVQHCDDCRCLYNLMLAHCKETWKSEHRPVFYGEMNSILARLKASPDYCYLRETNSQSEQQTLMALSQAYVNFCQKRAKEPAFHSKKGVQAFAVPQHFKVDKKHVRLPKIGLVKCGKHKALGTEIGSGTVVVEKNGEVYFSVNQIAKKPVAPKADKIISIDLGVKTWLTVYDGKEFEHIENPRCFKKYRDRILKLQRRLSRQQKGSGRWRHTKRLIAIAKGHEANCRLDCSHKVTTRLVRESQAILVEDLDVKGMMEKQQGERKTKREKTNARCLQDAGLGQMLRMLEYKCPKYGRTLVKVGRFFPSSKKCSTEGCTYVKHDLTQNDREWTCPACGKHHDRDDNAAVNIYSEGLKLLHSGVGTPSETKPKARALRQRLRSSRNRQAEAAGSSALR